MTPVQVPLLGPVVVTPGGIPSVNVEVSEIGAALVLPSVMFNVDEPPTGMVADTNALSSDGAKSSSVFVSDALAVDPGPELVVLVALTVLVIVGAVMLGAKLTGAL